VVHQPEPRVSGTDKLREVESHLTWTPSIRVLSDAWPRSKAVDGYRLPGALGFGRVPIEARTQLVENFLTSLADIASAMDVKSQPSSSGPEDTEAQSDVQAQKHGAHAKSENPPEDHSQPRSQPQDQPQTRAHVQGQGQGQAPTHQEKVLERPPVVIVKRVMSVPLRHGEGSSEAGKESVCVDRPSQENQPTSTTTSSSASASAMSSEGSVSGATISGVSAADSAAPGDQPTGAGTAAGTGVQVKVSDTDGGRAEVGISAADIEAWSSELRLLSEMGLHDIGVLLPLLRVHCLRPATVQQSRAIDPRAMQHVVRAALSLVR